MNTIKGRGEINSVSDHRRQLRRLPESRNPRWLSTISYLCVCCLALLAQARTKKLRDRGKRADLGRLPSATRLCSAGCQGTAGKKRALGRKRARLRGGAAAAALLSTWRLPLCSPGELHGGGFSGSDREGTDGRAGNGQRVFFCGRRCVLSSCQLALCSSYATSRGLLLRALPSTPPTMLPLRLLPEVPAQLPSSGNACSGWQMRRCKMPACRLLVAFLVRQASWVEPVLSNYLSGVL